MKHLGDITKINGAEIPVVDVITGGSPCQDLSVAGKRAGLAGERSGLFMEQIRIVKEMREQDVRSGRNPAYARPRYMVWENVPGAFSSGNPKGADFAAVLEEIIKAAEPGTDVRVRVPDGGWTKSGCYYAEDGTWSIAWRVHDAQFWGVPQRRKRIALVADFNGLSAAEILFDPQLRGEAENSKSNEAVRNFGAECRSEIQSECESLSRDFKPGEPQEKETAGAAGAGADLAISIQGNTIDRDVKQNGSGISVGVAHTLNATDRHGVAYAVDCRNGTENPFVNGTLQAKEQGYNVNSNNIVRVQKTTTVSAKYGTGGNNQPLGVNDTYQKVTGTLSPGGHPGSYNGQDAYNDMLVINQQAGPVQNSVVRRLTPLECERLQGYPDGWTDIGDWVDSKGKKHKAADSPRYKALGNSIALPFWFWLLRRISAQYERPATLGSLFDGIGGFPFCWERCNSKGTALWASEIEEFPIAVTKKHFGDDDAGIKGDI